MRASQVDVDGKPVVVRPWTLLPRGVDAMTFPSTILIRPQLLRNVDLLEHEYQHVRQWRRVGRIRFLARYLQDYLRGRAQGLEHHAAYRAISFEIEARAAAAARRQQRDDHSNT
jgi:hypothetical protein